MALDKDQVNALDRLRGQLAIAAKQLGSARENVVRGDPLQSWESLQGDVHFIVQNIAAVQDTLEKHREFLTSLHAYPLPSFPGHTHEALLQNLLRKKLDVAPEDWVAQYSKPDPQHNADGALGNRGIDVTQDTVDYEELWSSVAKESTPRARAFVKDGAFRDAYTMAEREAGVATMTTGLKRDVRKLPKDGKPHRQSPLFDLLGFKTMALEVEDGEDDEDDEDDDEGDDDDEEEKEDEDVHMKDVMPEHGGEEIPELGVDTTLASMPMETMLRFMTTGTLPEQR
ncbi:mediator of RNA polymerase II transcription subunit 8 [Friedmanniomyces endolithicus]|uniref:Mediator of RNA polymerase II transcription subunit 8 n=1 Tax=Friedmanniomyces endolithicus TaxID=329885 RepID=A0AAN6KZC1_9PEZI|nr:mediator of RNA polymerase II transcription subunit 8 [Friedmanniomyces endolithicus]KAK0831939.1 mediator of RNA polymerase II transcription subunit 8 [Friedmanniomyces endolithicus]KAK0864082.1 mediator of RNA polymerase II transcription subunit 8 [Friedmanniomyces endolithicus]KAK0881670.1 mediator of RNA polymerase II transcription subunit 8 [Friedmanniomyces endolithicus]KAK0903272.1 mediator of RNA polymerase II transcription subunit 8 [Friedmanniomyces endolithicus]